MTRKQFSSALDVLGVVDPYGARVEEAAGEMLITPDLEACHPDPNQPRHVLPDHLRKWLLGGASPTEVLWEAWRWCLGEDLYQAMRAHDLSPVEALARRREEVVLDLALQLTLEGLVELADSIVRHGLRSPINVYDLSGGRYRIAEGERRWWAHVVLRDVLLRVEAATILARVQPLPGDELAVLARQQAENAHRRDLSAIARSRAIVRVRETVKDEISGTDGSWGTEQQAGEGSFSGTGGSCEGAERRHPTENELDDLTGQRLAELTGKGIGGRMVRRYVALLSLPPEARALAEAAGLAERALRPIVSLDDAAEQVRLIHALAAGEMTPAQAATEAKHLKEPKLVQEKDIAAIAIARFRASLRFAASGDLPDPVGLADRIARLPPKKRNETLDWTRRYVSFLQAVLEAGERL